MSGARKSKRVFVSIDVELLKWIDKEATDRERERSYLVNQLIRRYRDKMEKARGIAKLRRKGRA